MAFLTGSKGSFTQHHGKRVMSMEEFKRWIIENFDADKDGKISKEELREVIRYAGGWFTKWKASSAVKSADTNSNGCIDGDEFKGLVDFALKQLHIKVVAH